MMSFEKERAEAVALVEEALEEFDIDATRAEIRCLHSRHD